LFLEARDGFGGLVQLGFLLVHLGQELAAFLVQGQIKIEVGLGVAIEEGLADEGLVLTDEFRVEHAARTCSSPSAERSAWAFGNGP
jgi:hypothetical protein